MAPTRRFTFFLWLLLTGALAVALPGCPSGDDDDDDDDSGEGEGECDPRFLDPGYECCPGDLTDQGTNTQTSFSDCGGCEQACNYDTAGSCVAGECMCGTNPPCNEGTELCCGRDKACIDPTTDPDNCGECDTSCIAPGTPEKDSDSCVDGACICSGDGEACKTFCSDHTTPCLESTCCPDEGGGSSCHDLLTEVDNCGGCALADRAEDDTHHRDDGILDSQYACDPLKGNLCRLANCICGVPSDIGVDPAPCEGTRNSTCCVPPGTPIDAVCADLDTDEAHCGVCNNPCNPGDVCTDGACVPG